MSALPALDQARESYLASHPFDPHKNALMGQDMQGNPAGFLTLPDMGGMQVLAAKLGFDYLARCTSGEEEDIEEWIVSVIRLADSPDLAGIMFANVFRGIDLFLGHMLSTTGLVDAVRSIAIQSWEKDFTTEGDTNE